MTEEKFKTIEEIKHIIKNSQSLEILRNLDIKERRFHEHTHILYDLRTLLGSEKCIYVEIGTYVGTSARLLLEHPFPTKIYAIDPCVLNRDHYGGDKDQYSTIIKNTQKIGGDFTLFKNYSTDRELLKIFNYKKIDLLFIDGDHSFNGVINDFNNWEKFIAIGGYIVFDDYSVVNFAQKLLLLYMKSSKI